MAFTADGRRAIVAAAIAACGSATWKAAATSSGSSATPRACGRSRSRPTAKFAISGSMDGTARVWDLANGLEVAKYADHTSLVIRGRFHAQRQVGRLGWLRRHRGLLEGRERPGRLACGESRARHGDSPSIPRGSSSRWRTDTSLILLDLKDGREVRRYGKFLSPLSAIAVSPNGKWIAAGNDAGVIRVWEVGKGKARFTLTGHVGGVRSIAIKDGGRWVLTGRRGPHAATLGHSRREADDPGLPQARRKRNRSRVPR